MNVFVIPSWFPHRCYPLEGVYVRDLVLAAGELRPGWRLAVSLWGQGRGEVSLRHFRRSPRCLVESVLDRRSRIECWSKNVFAAHRGAFHGTGRLLTRTREVLLRVNRENLARAEEQVGSVDLIHAHVAYPAGWIAARLARERGIPFVVTEHMGPFPLPSYRAPDGTLAVYVREPLAAAAAVVAVSEALAERIAAHGLPRPVVVPNLIDERLYHPAPTADRPEFVFYSVCGMERSKGVDDLLQAARRFLQDLPEAERARVRFRLGGEGPELARYRTLATRLGLDRWVTWLGFLPREASRLEFQRCDCFVLASRHESFGIVFLEAMASGRPSIATRCGGPEGIVTPSTGLLVPVGDVERLAEALATMFRGARGLDPGAIRAEFDRRFGRAATVERLERVYRRALADGRADATRAVRSGASAGGR